MIKGIKTIEPELSVDDRNSCVFIVKDITNYNDIEAYCIDLYVLPPGFSPEQTIHIENLNQGFDLVIDKCLLGLQSAPCVGEREELSDGLYVFKLVIDGKEYTKVVYRVNKLFRIYSDILCCVYKKARESQFAKEIYKEISMMRIKIDAIKSLGENCNCSYLADWMYKDVYKELKKLNCKYCDC